jgi:hypothetical protein
MRVLSRKQGWRKLKKEQGYEHQNRVKGFSMQMGALKMLMESTLALIKMDEQENNIDQMTTAQMLEECKRQGIDISDITMVKTETVAINGRSSAADQVTDSATIEGSAVPVRSAKRRPEPPGGFPFIEGDDQSVPWGKLSREDDSGGGGGGGGAPWGTNVVDAVLSEPSAPLLDRPTEAPDEPCDERGDREAL